MTQLYLLSSDLLSPSDLCPHDGLLTSPLCFSSRCPSACLCLKEAPKSPAALWEGFVLERHSFWPFYPRRIAPFLRPCWKSVQLFWWPFQMQEEDKCRVCCSSCPLGVRQARRRPLSDCLTCTDYFLCLFLITLLTQLLKMLCPSFFLSLSLFNAVFLTCLSPFLFYFLPLQLTRSLCLTLVHDLKGDVCNV